MSNTRTIAELEVQRYDWIAAECCKGTVWVPFRRVALVYRLRDIAG